MHVVIFKYDYEHEPWVKEPGASWDSGLHVSYHNMKL